MVPFIHEDVGPFQSPNLADKYEQIILPEIIHTMKINLKKSISIIKKCMINDSLPVTVERREENNLNVPIQFLVLFHIFHKIDAIFLTDIFISSQ